jgi:hypothetical protein
MGCGCRPATRKGSARGLGQLSQRGTVGGPLSLPHESLAFSGGYGPRGANPLAS